MALVLKTSDVQASVGSNPTLSVSISTHLLTFAVLWVVYNYVHYYILNV